MRRAALLLLFLITAGACAGDSREDEASRSGGEAAALRVYSVQEGRYVMTEKIERTDAEWREALTPEQYRILREKGTERAFTGAYWNNHEEGVYRCAGCGLELFSSEAKFESGTGWPSYTEPVASENIRTRPDNSFFMRRTEVVCARCGGHLGHVFEDGPRPTGLRYCLNSAALAFDSAQQGRD